MSLRTALVTGLLVALLALQVGVRPLAAQADTTKPRVLPPVEVVATRRPEAPHDVPASIEVISGDDLHARGATTLRDALSLAAGVVIAPGGDGGPASSIPEFWGLREFDAFLLVVDGIPWGGALNPALSTLDLHDVLRIEILRGPAPVTFGATSFVGVIHVVHNAAYANSRTLSVRGGSYGTGAVSTDFGIPTSGAWKSRVSAGFERQGFRDDRTEYKRGHALWRVAKTNGDRSTWLSADVTLLRQDPASPHPLDGTTLSTTIPLDANYNPAGAFLNENRFAVSGGWQRPIGGGAVWGTTASFTHSTQDMFRGFLLPEIINGPDNAAGFKEGIELTDVYLDTHVLWSAKSRLRFMAGADGLFANGEATGATFDYTAPLSGTTAPVVPEPTTLDRDAEVRRIFAGAYGSVEWQPVDRVTFSGGLRANLTSERRDEASPSVSHTRLSGSLGALFGLWEQNADHFRLFANFRSTFKPAAFDFGLAENEGILDPETSESYEAGMKLRAANGRVDMEASVFLMNFKNLVTPTILNNLPALINSGKTRFKGFEVATDLRLAPDVFARASYSFHDAKFVDFETDLDGVLTQLGGHRIEMSTRHLLSGGLSYWPASGFTAHVGFNYTGSRFLDPENEALAPGFATIDAGIGYRLRRAEFRVDAVNLSNRRDAVSESEFGDAQFYRMTPRMIQAGIVLRY